MERTFMDLALVTGASSGIGRAIAEVLAARGVDLIVVARGAEALGELAAALRARIGVAVHVLPADLSLPAEVERLCGTLGRLELTPTILINAAAVGATGALADAEPGALSGLVRLDVEAPVRLTRHVLPGMLARERGYILNVTSMVAAFPVPFMAAYGASKAFLSSFTHALREELRGTPIVVAELAPGVVTSRFAAAAGYSLTAAERRSSMTPEAVARSAVDELFAGRAFHVPGPLNALAALALRIVPGWVMAFFTARFMRAHGRDRSAPAAPAVAAATLGGEEAA